MWAVHVRCGVPVRPMECASAVGQMQLTCLAERSLRVGLSTLHVGGDGQKVQVTRKCC